MINLKTAALTVLAGTALLGTTLAPAFAQRPYDNGYGNGSGYGRGYDRNDQNNGERGQVRWSGVVDDTAIITIRGRDVQTRTTAGQGVTNVSEQMNGRLPSRHVNVNLRRVSGRGQVEVIEQPSPRNNFTARVRVRDSQGGSAHYSFVLNWGR